MNRSQTVSNLNAEDSVEQHYGTITPEAAGIIYCMREPRSSRLSSGRTEKFSIGGGQVSRKRNQTS